MNFFGRERKTRLDVGDEADPTPQEKGIPMADLPGQQVATGLPTQIDPANPEPTRKAVQDWLDKENAIAQDRSDLSLLIQVLQTHREDIVLWKAQARAAGSAVTAAATAKVVHP